MKDYFCVYPHCLVIVKGEKVLILDPYTKLYVFSDNAEIVKACTVDDNYTFPAVKKGKAFYAEATSKDLGYLIKAEHSPFTVPPKLTFISSMEKERKALGYSTGWRIPSLIKTVSLYLNNNNILLPNELLYDQLAYPRHNETEEVMTRPTWERMLAVLKSPYVETVFVCGDIDELLIESLGDILDECNCSVVIRTSIQELDKAAKLIAKHPKIAFDFIINGTDSMSFVEKYQDNNNFSYTLPVMTTDDLAQLETLKISVKFIPLIHNAIIQNEIVGQMLLSFNDILKSVSSVDDYLRKDYFNANFWGHIALTKEGTLLVGDDIVGNINDKTACSLMTDYLQKAQNLWKLTRNKKSSCKDCLLTSLCPSISIYERQGIIERACNDGTDL